jgi:hypothetical protein
MKRKKKAGEFVDSSEDLSSDVSHTSQDENLKSGDKTKSPTSSLEKLSSTTTAEKLCSKESQKIPKKKSQQSSQFPTQPLFSPENTSSSLSSPIPITPGVKERMKNRTGEESNSAPSVSSTSAPVGNIRALVEMVRRTCFKYMDENILLSNRSFLFLYLFHRVLFALLGGYPIRRYEDGKAKEIGWVKDHFHQNVTKRKEDERSGSAMEPKSNGRNSPLLLVMGKTDEGGEERDGEQRKGDGESSENAVISISRGKTSNESKNYPSILSFFHTSALDREDLVSAVANDVLLPSAPSSHTASSLQSYMCYPCYVPLPRTFTNAVGTPFKDHSDPSGSVHTSSQAHRFRYSLYSRTHRNRLRLSCDEEIMEWDSEDSEDEVCIYQIFMLSFFLIA